MGVYYVAPFQSRSRGATNHQAQEYYTLSSLSQYILSYQPLLQPPKVQIVQEPEAIAHFFAMICVRYLPETRTYLVNEYI